MIMTVHTCRIHPRLRTDRYATMLFPCHPQRPTIAPTSGSHSTVRRLGFCVMLLFLPLLAAAGAQKAPESPAPTRQRTRFRSFRSFEPVHDKKAPLLSTNYVKTPVSGRIYLRYTELEANDLEIFLFFNRLY